MTTINKQQITAVILAGGQSSRMYGQDKGLIKINKKPLIKFVIDVIVDEVSTILISTNRHHQQYQTLIKGPVISDDMSGFQGPLAGFTAAMKITKTPYLLVVPCDCPLVGEKLLVGLKNAIANSDAEISVAHDGVRMQPTFVLLKTSLLSSLLTYLQQGERKIDLWYQQHKVTQVDFSNEKDYFANLNKPTDYALFIQSSKIHNVPVLGFCAFSGTGKTTLITKIIKHLTQNNMCVAYLKHAHHSFETDYPGKDSYECYHAGAKQVLISSTKKFALISRYDTTHSELDLFSLVEKLDVAQLDLILVEGFKHENIKKIELQRVELDNPNLFSEDDNIIAIASNNVNARCDRVVLDINNINEIIDFIQAYSKKIV